MNKSKSRFTKIKNKSFYMLLFIVLFAIIGVILLVLSKAATPAIGIEVENGIVLSPASKVSDSSASGGKYIKFGSGITGTGGATNRNRLGVDINQLPTGISMAKAYDTIKSLGFGWVRTGPGISDYNNLNPNNFDYELSQAKRTNTKVLIVMTYAYGNTGSSGCNNGHCKPKDPAAWARYAGRLVAHWKSLYPGQVGAVEVWNESNNPQFWDPVDPAAYTDLLKRTYLEIKAVDPTMPIIVSGPAPGGGNQDADKGSTIPSSGPMNPATYYKQIYANGGKGFFDAAANHPYDTYNLGSNVVGSGIRNNFWIRKVMNANGDGSKQIWGTEAGVVSCLQGPGNNAPMTETQRANRLASDLQDFWYGTHDQIDGHTINTTAKKSDWNAGPYFVFKLYKTTGDPGLGIVYNTNSYMQSTSNTDAAKEPLCKSSRDYFEPAIADVIRYISASAQ